MRLAHNERERILVRAAFTLIELLVVIAIIAILVALLSAAVMRVLWKGPELQARHDVTQMAIALGASKAKLGGYPPSRIKLCSLKAQYDFTQQLDLDSVAYLQSTFTGLANTWSNTPVGWGMNGTVLSSPVVLTGDQCLVFFLGGIQTTDSNGTRGTIGFATGNDPTALPTTQGSTRIGPFFTFASNRLVPGANGFFSYMDAWGKQPYAYFSSYSWKSRNMYNRYGSSDCANLGVSPYYSSTMQNGVVNYVKPEEFQIITAGQDGAFGPGGLWSPQMPADGPGLDDLSNFYDARLGVPGSQ
jgi:prepilin-type N-terminal cleavage/methylation domain-containing protein